MKIKKMTKKVNRLIKVNSIDDLTSLVKVNCDYYIAIDFNRENVFVFEIFTDTEKTTILDYENPNLDNIVNSYIEKGIYSFI